MKPEVQVLSEQRIDKLDIEEFVQNATWRELLFELVESKKLDPWDINISKMLDAYAEVVKKMRVLDLRVPANIVLAASILLRLKSESLDSLYEQEESGESVEMQAGPRPAVDVPNLVAKTRIQQNRKITLQELVAALDSAMKFEGERKRYVAEIQMPISITISEDIDKRTSKIYSIIKSSIDSFGMTTFTILAKNFNTLEEKLLKLFIPLLFLAQNEVIGISQEEFFGEIIIKLNDEHGKSAAKR